MRTKLGILAAGLAAGGVATMALVSGFGSAGAVTLLASTSTSAKGANVCETFLGHLASDLGVSQGKLDSAYRSAADQTIQAAVKAGKLSQKRASRLEARVAKAPACSDLRLAVRRAALRKGYLTAAASVLGLNLAELRSDLKSGDSLGQLAQQKGLSESQFRAALLKIVTPELNTAVSDHRLSSAAEQRMLKRLQSGTLPLWSRAHKSSSATSSSTSV